MNSAKENTSARFKSSREEYARPLYCRSAQPRRFARPSESSKFSSRSSFFLVQSLQILVHSLQTLVTHAPHPRLAYLKQYCAPLQYIMFVWSTLTESSPLDSAASLCPPCCVLSNISSIFLVMPLPTSQYKPAGGFLVGKSACRFLRAGSLSAPPSSFASSPWDCPTISNRSRRVRQHNQINISPNYIRLKINGKARGAGGGGGSGGIKLRLGLGSNGLLAY